VDNAQCPLIKILATFSSSNYHPCAKEPKLADKIMKYMQDATSSLHKYLV
jgi:hypothetical protein